MWPGRQLTTMAIGALALLGGQAAGAQLLPGGGVSVPRHGGWRWTAPDGCAIWCDPILKFWK